MKKPIYLDYNGTTPNDPEVIAAMRPYIEEEFGNPSSGHLYGVAPRRAVEAARAQVAGLLGCDPAEIIFTSGGTESNNHAIKGIAEKLSDRGNHIVTSAVEHPAVLEVCRYLRRYGRAVTVLPVDEFGQVRAADVAAAIRPETILVTIMHANNEVGTLQPITEIAEICRSRGILFHTDAAQSVGKVPTDVMAPGVSLLSVAGHKVYAPKGIGALYLRAGVEVEKFCHGAGQEGGRRAGTENVIEIVGLGKACEIAARDLEKNRAHMAGMRDRLHDGITGEISNVRLNGHPTQRLPNTLSLSFLGLEANRILEEIGLAVAASAGAACHADSVEISHVLTAMKIPEEWAKGTIRFTVGRPTRAEEIDRAVEAVVAAVKRLRG